MGRLYLEILDEDGYCCSVCKCQLARSSDVQSKTFHSRNGQAYLFRRVFNVVLGARENRVMTTGMHTVSDAHCTTCYQLCGWKYEIAHEQREKYKEGMFVLEREKLKNTMDGKPGYVATPLAPRTRFADFRPSGHIVPSVHRILPHDSGDRDCDDLQEG